MATKFQVREDGQGVPVPGLSFRCEGIVQAVTHKAADAAKNREASVWMDVIGMGFQRSFRLKDPSVAKVLGVGCSVVLHAEVRQFDDSTYAGAAWPVEVNGKPVADLVGKS